MKVYNLSAVGPSKEVPRNRELFSFDVFGAGGAPVVSFSFETQAEAEYARNAMLAIVARAKLVTPHTD
jgi:hypothetical protein